MRTTFFLVSIAAIFGVSSAHAISRSCALHYEIEFTQGYGWLDGQKIGTASFAAKGGCGRTVPNRCRRRARNVGLKCMTAHWTSPAKLPAECRSKSVRNISKALSTIGPREIATIEAVDFAMFIYGPRQRNMNPRTREFSQLIREKQLKANVWAVSAGNTGCSQRVLLAKDFPISMNTVKKATYKVALKKAAAFKHPKPEQQHLRLTQTRSVKLGRKRLVPVTKTGVFLERSGDRFLAAEREDSKYLGCGRKAGQNFLRYLGIDVSQAYISRRMKLNSVLGAKKWFGNLAVVPKELEKGVRRILTEKGLRRLGAAKKKGSIDIRRFRRVTNPQKHIERQILDGKSPVIALVNDGNHWVVATGAWSPVFDRASRYRRFVTHDMQRTTWWSWSTFNLKFGKGQTAAIPVAGGVYKPGTMLFLR